jgi:hypothetical protein
MLNFKDWLIENEDKKRRVNIGRNSRTPGYAARPEILAMKESSSESEVLFLYNNDENLEKIKKETGRSVGDIYRILKKNQISPSRTKKKHGLIKYFSDSGYDISDIAIKVGKSNQSVKNAMKKQ